MSLPETLEKGGTVADVLDAIEEVARQRDRLLIPAMLRYLDSDNEAFRAKAIAMYFVWMPEDAVAILPRAIQMLTDDPSVMVRGAAAGAFGVSVRKTIPAQARLTMAEALARRLRDEPSDTVRHTLYASLHRLVGRGRDDIPWELPTEQVDWAAVDAIVRALSR